jgi:hypothetical protein
MGSKSAALELTRISVDMKVLIEQMREQVQNIEMDAPPKRPEGRLPPLGGARPLWSGHAQRAWNSFRWRLHTIDIDGLPRKPVCCGRPQWGRQIEPGQGAHGAGRPGVAVGVAHHARAARPGKTRPRVLFCVQQEFDAMVLGDAFVEWAHVHGHRYGTSKKAIEDRIAQGADVILEIDFQGAIQIKKVFANAVLIFILPPSWEELRSRLERRGEDAPT